MRLYSFVAGNYIKQIQCGIQTAHGVHELFIHNSSNKLLFDWAINHKTIIVLNAGNQDGVQKVENFFNILNSWLPEKLPTCLVREDEHSLNNCVTAFCVVLPEIYYTEQQTVDSAGELLDIDSAAATTYSFIKQFRLA